MTKIHKALIKPKKPEKLTLNFKVVEKEANAVKAMARKYTRGNVTALVRLAIADFKPRPSDLVDVRRTTRS